MNITDGRLVASGPLTPGGFLGDGAAVRGRGSGTGTARSCGSSTAVDDPRRRRRGLIHRRTATRSGLESSSPWTSSVPELQRKTPLFKTLKLISLRLMKYFNTQLNHKNETIN